MTEPNVRRRPPMDREAVIHRMEIAGYKGYAIVGMYEDGNPCELFLEMAKEGSTISGLLDAFAIAVSIALQYGAPLKVLEDKFIGMKFEPAGFTKNPEIETADSIMDYLFRWLRERFPKNGGTKDDNTTSV